MSAIEESQTLPTLSDAITSGSNSNPTKKNIRTNFRESKEVNEKIFELISDRHKNDINEGKDDNDTKLKNKSFLDRIKKKGKQEDISQENEENEKLEDMIQIKENEPTMTLTTLNDLIENKNENENEIKEQKNDEENSIKEKSEENIEFNNKIEINEETKPEIKEEIITEIKEEKDEIKDEIKEEKDEIKEETKEENIEIKKDEDDIINIKEENNNDNKDNIEIKALSDNSQSRNSSKSKTSNNNKSRNNSKSSSKSKTTNKIQESTYSNNSIKESQIQQKKIQSEIISNKINLKSKSNEKRKIKNNLYSNKVKQIKKTQNEPIVKIKAKKKKFNEEQFQKQLEFFKQCEKKKQEKIEKLKKEKIKKELATINNKKNIHYHKKLPKKKLPSLLDRLYTKDIQKRKEKNQILTKIYTPSFTPFLYSKGNNNNFQKQQSNNIINNNEDNNTYNESDNNYNEDYYEPNTQIVNASQKGEKMNKKIKFNIEENIPIVINEDEENDEIVQIHNRVVVENALRNKLFHHGNKNKRNKSAENRKK